MIRAAFLTLMMAVMGAVSAPIYAHAQKAAITRVVFNPRTTNLEVMHRFLLHDAEHAVKEIFGGDADIIGSADTQQKFAEYVHERFSITNADSEKLELELVGHELEGKYIWVYQDVKIPTVTSLTIEHNALRELWPTQINTVNVEGKKGLKTATFSDSVELITINLDGVHH